MNAMNQKTKTKKKPNLGVAVQAIRNLDAMVAKGAIRFHYGDTYTCHLLEELFWAGKPHQHHTNLAKNLLAYMDISSFNADGSVPHTLEIHSILTGAHLGTFTGGHLTYPKPAKQ